MEDILIGTTDRTILVFIPDPASTTGQGKTGLTHASFTVSVTRVETDNDVVVTDVTSSLTTLSALTDAHADWGVKEVSSTLAPGLYRLDVADSVFASGAWTAVVNVMITSGTAAATPKAFRLVARNDLNGVNLGLTALPSVAPGLENGLPVLDGAFTVMATLANVEHGGGAATLQLSNVAFSTLACGPVTLGTTQITASDTDETALTVTGNGAGRGVLFVGGNAGATGFRAEGGTSGKAVEFIGEGIGNGLVVQGGATGDAVQLLGGATSGHGLRVITVDGHGFHLSAVGSGRYAIRAQGTAGDFFSVAANADIAARIDAAITTRMATFSLPTNFSSLGINASGHVERVVLTDTVTTLTGHTPQSGDAYGVVNSGTHGNAALKTLIDVIDGIVDSILVATGDIYHAKIGLTIDEANSQDEWTVAWFKNGVRLTSGVTSPAITVIKRADGTNLINAASMNEVGSTESFKYDATTTARITAGEAVVVLVTATIDAGTRTWLDIVSRDSAGA